ncbi:hypothetical protein CPCC7001_1778 [Cyanobium sp. PCC 7001]|nr:hypothetical protein CPCC7001_1778 [Cyanobium sp. PCC 7001]
MHGTGSHLQRNGSFPSEVARVTAPSWAAAEGIGSAGSAGATSPRATG